MSGTTKDWSTELQQVYQQPTFRTGAVKGSNNDPLAILIPALWTAAIGDVQTPLAAQAKAHSQEKRK